MHIVLTNFQYIRTIKYVDNFCSRLEVSNLVPISKFDIDFLVHWINQTIIQNKIVNIFVLQ